MNIKELFPEVDTNTVSDGYHNFGELYEHRITLYIALCALVSDVYAWDEKPVWKSKKHSDGSVWDGWFILGIGSEQGKQITYHLPMSKWDECYFREIPQAFEWDGHTSQQVLERLKQL